MTIVVIEWPEWWISDPEVDTLQTILHWPKKICETSYIVGIFGSMCNLYGRQGVWVYRSLLGFCHGMSRRMIWSKRKRSLNQMRLITSLTTHPSRGLKLILSLSRPLMLVDYIQTPCRPCKLHTFSNISMRHKLSQIFLGLWSIVWRHEPDSYFRITDSPLRPLSNNNFHGSLP